jgi:hypothetical protein
VPVIGVKSQPIPLGVKQDPVAEHRKMQLVETRGVRREGIRVIAHGPLGEVDEVGVPLGCACRKLRTT